MCVCVCVCVCLYICHIMIAHQNFKSSKIRANGNFIQVSSFQISFTDNTISFPQCYHANFTQLRPPYNMIKKDFDQVIPIHDAVGQKNDVGSPSFCSGPTSILVPHTWVSSHQRKRERQAKRQL